MTEQQPSTKSAISAALTARPMWFSLVVNGCEKSATPLHGPLCFRTSSKRRPGAGQQVEGQGRRRVLDVLAVAPADDESRTAQDTYLIARTGRCEPESPRQLGGGTGAMTGHVDENRASRPAEQSFQPLLAGFRDVERLFHDGVDEDRVEVRDQQGPWVCASRSTTARASTPALPDA